MNVASRSVAVAVSGGVDSLYSLLCLKEQGCAVAAMHARFVDPLPGKDAVPGLQRQCDILGVPLYLVDLREQFAQEVIRPFVDAYSAAKTPNPCAICNPRMKFGALLDAAHAVGASHIATGHYAQWEVHPVYGEALRRGSDRGKDQSYFLALVPRERLACAVFPMARVHKPDAVRAVAAHGLQVPLPGESQEICFVQDNSYRNFLVRQHACLSGSGPMTLADGTVVGMHKGLWQYTQGQRKGLGIAWSEPLYVLDKDVEHNTLLVGRWEELPVDGCLAMRLNELVPRELWPKTLHVQTRYRQHEIPATVDVDGDSVEVLFDQPQIPAAPGQILVIYDDDGWVLGGAFIVSNIGRHAV